MCQDCGCNNVNKVEIDGVTYHNHSHHSHPHTHPHKHSHHSPREVTITRGILSKNDRLAAQNRDHFQSQSIYTLNLLSSPGSGKTALIERTLKDTGNELKIGVIVGDLETDNDAQRIRNSNAPAIQITTGNACHLEAEMIAKAMKQLDLSALNLLIIENVGNLVCPAAYDLGETLRVVLLSTTEGEDKPLKYPTTFKTAQVVIVNKIDIAEVVGFDREKAMTNIQKVAPQATIFAVSAKTGEGMNQWYTYLRKMLPKNQAVMV
ncbi:hydrogenase nickel incorporation protein HypB [Oscillatoria salina]|uniref:hydrogenase nickel incorporation protein HypB n=1 Tax=Oscillatoria salina TaxID=331517 RepID=UPI0013BC04A5|nr:hydrogenase nickel incorporation protein HypB [Oscillatoria salina]MBZ8181092.1 hydrogenase nickel incorporation protein HypB [Oscillatoria salina IIICB1]NET90850.1 hydrogenase nickel incorporation protein HypB [Kamptonema sp. SIO1D9]